MKNVKSVLKNGKTIQDSVPVKLVERKKEDGGVEYAMFIRKKDWESTLKRLIEMIGEDTNGK